MSQGTALQRCLGFGGMSVGCGLLWQWWFCPFPLSLHFPNLDLKVLGRVAEAAVSPEF